MTSQGREWQRFQHGSDWVRANFHMHTRADKEFKHDKDDNGYLGKYVEALKAASIAIGVITNHNKFDFDEFKNLAKKARKEEIFLLPGVELSIGDGGNGIHTLVVFSEDWLAKGQDYINPFLTRTFEGKTPLQYENENGRSSQSLVDTVKTLNGYEKDYFLVFAHVHQASGLWEEMDGGRQLELVKNETVMERVLGFQKVTDRDKRAQHQQWWKDRYPAEVQGCDCKEISQIGKGDSTYIKVGDFSFSAVKQALRDHPSRVASEKPKYQHSRLLSASYLGGKLDGKSIKFSAQLNTLIGIRGSGKSSILESVRYALDIPFGDQAADQEYKKGSIANLLGSGGKVTLEIRNRHGRHCRVERLLHGSSDIYVDNEKKTGISLGETCLHRPIYFGQKDLSNTRTGFEKDLIEKLVGADLRDVREAIENQRDLVQQALKRLAELDNQQERKDEWAGRKKTAEHKLETYRSYGLEEKLATQVGFDQDVRKCQEIERDLKALVDDLDGMVARHEERLKNHLHYKSSTNDSFFADHLQTLANAISVFEKLGQCRNSLNADVIRLAHSKRKLESKRDELKEQFAADERKIARELETSESLTLTTEEFKKLRQVVESATKILESLTTLEETRQSRQAELSQRLSELRDSWHQEHRQLKAALSKVAERSQALKIEVEFQGDKASFAGYMKDLFRGSKLRQDHFDKLAESYSDFAEMFGDLAQAKSLAGGMSEVFERYFLQNLPELLTWKVPDKVTILYHGKELKNHSLGQRASALILFVLNSSDSDLVIIDQPEDDLDNQTIYEDVIKLMKDMKPQTQFLIATHNPNFPVLGDAEQVLSCRFENGAIEVNAGSIDRACIQRDIVAIMEGGEEAFRRRGMFYTQWKPQKSTS